MEVSEGGHVLLEDRKALEGAVGQGPSGRDAPTAGPERVSEAEQGRSHGDEGLLVLSLRDVIPRTGVGEVRRG